MDILDYLDLALNVASWGILGYSVPLFALELPSMIFSKKIKNEEQLEAMLGEEISNLDFKKGTNIGIRFGKASGWIGHSCQLESDSYEIVLGKLGRNRAVLKHELYHISRGHFQDFNRSLKYLFVNEPQAVIYQSLGIKL